MVVEGFLAAAWAAGVAEGASVLSDAEKRMEPRHIVPAVLYGTISIPLGLFGASPGIATISMLPFSPPLQVLQKQGIPAPAAAGSGGGATAVENATPKAPAIKIEKKEKRPNRRPVVVEAPKPRKVPPPAPTFLATLDGRVLPTPLAEAMRRARFLLLGAGIVSYILLSQKQKEEKKQQEETLALEKKVLGKDASAITNLMIGKANGAAVRFCPSLNKFPLGRNDDLRPIATIPLLLDDSGASNKKIAVDKAKTETYWDPGQTPTDWIQTPLTSKWLMRGKDAQRLVLEADISSMEDTTTYFKGSQKDDSLSKFLLLSTTLSNMALRKHIITTPAVKVILGSASNRPTSILPHDENTIYLNGPEALGREITSQLNSVYDTMEEEFVAVKKQYRSDQKTAHEAATQAALVAKKASVASETSTLQAAIRESTSVVNGLGSSIRGAMEYTGTSVVDIHDGYISNRRVVHVLSDSPAFVQFIQRTLSGGWKVVWYDVSKANHVQQFLQKPTPISLVCCQNDVTTSAWLATCAASAEESNVLAVFTQPDSVAPSSVAKTICIRAVHDVLFESVRQLLSDGKSVQETQQIVSNSK